jgi:phosphoribosylformylglycinamidine cyclo-ligase
VRVDRSTWARPAVFSLVADVGHVSQPDLEQALNIGVGMVAVVAPEVADDAVRILGEHGIEAWVAGDIAAGGVHGPGGSVTLTGQHA